MNFGAGRTYFDVHYFQFNEPRDLLLVDNCRLLVVADYGANKVLVHNVSSGFVNSICKFSQDAGSADGRYRPCKFTRPWGLMVDGYSLYVGTSDGLLKTGQNRVCYVQSCLLIIFQYQPISLQYYWVLTGCWPTNQIATECCKCIIRNFHYNRSWFQF